MVRKIGLAKFAVGLMAAFTLISSPAWPLERGYKIVHRAPIITAFQLPAESNDGTCASYSKAGTRESPTDYSRRNRRLYIKYQVDIDCISQEYKIESLYKYAASGDSVAIYFLAIIKVTDKKTLCESLGGSELKSLADSGSKKPVDIIDTPGHLLPDAAYTYAQALMTCGLYSEAIPYFVEASAAGLEYADAGSLQAAEEIRKEHNQKRGGNR